MIYSAVAVALAGAAALAALPRLIRSLLTPSLSARRTVYTPDRPALRVRS